MARLAKPLVFVADDDSDILLLMERYLSSLGWEVFCAADKKHLLAELSRRVPQLLLLDVCFGEHDGVELLPQLHADQPRMAIALMTAHGTIDNAVTAMKRGAFDYLPKPVELPRLLDLLNHAREYQAFRADDVPRLEQLGDASEPRYLRGPSAALCRVRELIATVGPTDATVLILGESGTGKELVARALHEQSARKQKPFVPVNMAALPRELVESTLFGHERGAFTGADQPQLGCCEAADQGTLFLDEIGEMDLALQSKLLRFLQERTVQRVGSSKSKPVDVRVLAATNRDLLDSVQAGTFREDLYYRLNVVPILVPPLRERPQDIGPLAEWFLTRFKDKYHKSLEGFTPEVLDCLLHYDWPGNVRQLENLVERMVILSASPSLGYDLLPEEVQGRRPHQFHLALAKPDSNFKTDARSMEQLEKQAILGALRDTRGNVREAALVLGCGQATVYRKLKRYGITLENQGRTAIS